MLTEAFGWIGEYMRGLLSMLPQRRFVRRGHGAIRYSPGGRIEVLEAGWYIFWPLVQEFEEFPIMRQTQDVPKQALDTKCGVTVSVGGVIRWSVVNLEKFCVDNYNTFEDVEDVAQIALRDVVVANDYVTLQTDQRRVDRALRRSAQRRLTPYGVRVHSMSLKTLAPTQLIHIVGDRHSEPIVLPHHSATE